MVSAKNICKTYGDFSLKLDMEVLGGRITGLVGRNGAGKSTTIRMILGLTSPDSGELEVLGKPVKLLTAADRQYIGAALSDSGFSGYLTVKDAAKILEAMYPDFNKADFLEKCRRSGLPQDKQIQKFSTGMKARLRVLTAVSHSAKLLIMDEPTAGMDVEARGEILDIIRDYLTEHEDSAVLITSHIASDLESMCDDIYLIDGGRILLHEDTDVILSEYGILKMDARTYETVDRQYLLASEQEAFGCRCLTNQRAYYAENYPGMVVEACGIDDLILMLTGR